MEEHGEGGAGNLVVKAYLEWAGKREETRRFSIHTTTNVYQELQNGVRGAYSKLEGLDFILTWTDCEGDRLSLRDNDDVRQAISESSQDGLKVNVEIQELPWWKQAHKYRGDGTTEEHPGISCSCCHKPVKGFRYKCLVCPNYDMCANCEYKGLHPAHDMLRISSPRVYPPHFFTRLHRLYERSVLVSPTIVKTTSIPNSPNHDQISKVIVDEELNDLSDLEVEVALVSDGPTPANRLYAAEPSECGKEGLEDLPSFEELTKSMQDLAERDLELCEDELMLSKPTTPVASVQEQSEAPKSQDEATINESDHDDQAQNETRTNLDDVEINTDREDDDKETNQNQTENIINSCLSQESKNDRSVAIDNMTKRCESNIKPIEITNVDFQAINVKEMSTNYDNQSETNCDIKQKTDKNTDHENLVSIETKTYDEDDYEEENVHVSLRSLQLEIDSLLAPLTPVRLREPEDRIDPDPTREPDITKDLPEEDIKKSELKEDMNTDDAANDDNANSNESNKPAPTDVDKELIRHTNDESNASDKSDSNETIEAVKKVKDAEGKENETKKSENQKQNNTFQRESRERYTELGHSFKEMADFTVTSVHPFNLENSYMRKPRRYSSLGSDSSATYSRSNSSSGSGSSLTSPSKIPFRTTSRIAEAVESMKDMGFSDDDGWLTQLLVMKHGDISQVLDLLTPVKK